MAADRHRNFRVVERKPLLMISPFVGTAQVDTPNAVFTPQSQAPHTSQYATTKDSLQVRLQSLFAAPRAWFLLSRLPVGAALGIWRDFTPM